MMPIYGFPTFPITPKDKSVINGKKQRGVCLMMMITISKNVKTLTLKIRGTVGFRTDINVCAFLEKI